MVMFVIDRKMRQKEDFENVGRQFTFVFVSSSAINAISMAFWFTTDNDFPGRPLFSVLIMTTVVLF